MKTSAFKLVWLPFIFTLFIRLPFFFRDYIDHDESTFILMAQSWVDGHLPYTHLWDLKPPLVFLLLAIPIKVFGKSFIAVRFMGVIAVWITSIFTAKIGKREGLNETSQFWISMLTVAFLSLFGSVQGIMSEHLSMAFFIPGLYLIWNKESIHKCFMAGILFGAALMCKLNLGYALVVVFLFLTFQVRSRKNLMKTSLMPICLGVGVLIPIGLLALPYLLTGQYEVWVNAVFLAPLAYTKGQGGLINVLPLFIVLICLFLVHNKLTSTSWNSLLWWVILGIGFSFFKVGKLNGHYLLQLYPLLLVIVVQLCSFLPFKRGTPYLGLLLLILPVESYLEWGTVAKNKAERSTFWNGEGFLVPEYLRGQKLEDQSVFYRHYHIGYWIQDKEPLTMVTTHPSNIAREVLYPFVPKVSPTPLEEMKYILSELKPKVLVHRLDKPFLIDEHRKEADWVKKYLQYHYGVMDTVGRAIIYKRL